MMNAKTAPKNRLMRINAVKTILRIFRKNTPKIFSLLLLVAGAMLLISASTPDIEDRVNWLKPLVPLSVMELSNLMATVSGIALLLLSRAVFLRIDSSYFITIIMLSVGIITSLMKGFNYETSIALSLLLIAFLPARKFFYRKSALLQVDLDNAWIAQISFIIILFISLGFFSFKHIEYSNDMLFQFGVENYASRFLRSLVAIGFFITFFMMYRVLTKPFYNLAFPSDLELEKANEIIHKSNDTTNYLALLGDKYFIFSDSGESFIMFDTTSRYWFAMGDPVGKPEEQEELVWKFREQADKYAAKIAFYQVGTESLPIYLDLGLSLTKLGEEAHVDLTKFSLEGNKNEKIRHAYNKSQKENLTFEIVPPENFKTILPELKIISDRWLKKKKAREKKFSLGFFDEAYLSHYNIAVLRKHGRIIAFANVIELDNKDEMSLSLMRYDPDSPNGVMEYLTILIMMWGKEQGYKWFNLGMSPLYGLEKHTLAPLWHKIGNTLFNLGNEFYNFEGLYKYKKKYNPVWKPRYFAAPSGVFTPSALLKVTSLISGGFKGIFTK